MSNGTEVHEKSWRGAGHHLIDGLVGYLEVSEPEDHEECAEAAEGAINAILHWAVRCKGLDLFEVGGRSRALFMETAPTDLLAELGLIEPVAAEDADLEPVPAPGQAQSLDHQLNMCGFREAPPARAARALDTLPAAVLGEMEEEGAGPKPVDIDTTYQHE